MPVIGKYEILEQLGAGSMGTVYKGRDTLLDRMVAIKTIRTGVNVELEAKERFYREARTCARLNHPHIVSVYDLGEENGTSFIAMELLGGADFRQLIERRETVPLAQKLTAMAQVCEALAFAHREGIIHRDIKPSNLFLLADGRAKVLDFGIAKLPTSHLTRAGAVLGTPNYMAPEQINGAPCDGRADLFSAAVVFFEFLTFTHPFKSNLIPRRILEDNPDSLLQHDPGLPRILEKVFGRALAKNPEDRYATGDVFAADLRAVIDAMALNASPTFSRVELPSQTSFAVPPPIPAAETAAPRAAVPDNQQWRAGQMLKLIPAFEASMDARDLSAARTAFAELQSVAGDDSRYRETVSGCRARLAQLESSPAPSSSGGKRCQKCANFNSADALFCVGCGASLSGVGTGSGMSAGTGSGLSSGVGSGARPLPPPPPLPPLPPRPQPPHVPEPVPMPPPVPPPAPPPAGLRNTLSDRKRLAIVAGLVLLGALLLIVGPMFFRSEKILPAIATARVSAQHARVLREASDGSKSITELERGALVNVLALPQSLSQGWTRVQAKRDSKFYAPGYLKASELGEWDSKDAATALALARMSGPLEAGADLELRAQIDKFNSVAAVFSGKPAADEAGLEAARLELALARRSKEANPLATDWQTSLADLSSRLETLRRNPSQQAAIDDLLKQIHALMPEQAAGTTAAAVLPAPLPVDQTPPGVPALTDTEAAYLMNAAQQALKDSRYNEALTSVGRVLRSQPQNAAAKALRAKIKDQIDFEKSLR